MLFEELFSAIFAIKDLCIQSGNGAYWSTILGILMTAILEPSVIGGDLDSRAYLATIRSFIQNHDNIDREFDYNGKKWIFAGNKAQCCSPNEAQFFLAQSAERGYNFSSTSVIGWFSNYVISFFGE